MLSIVSMVTFLSLPGVDTALTRSVGEGHDGSYAQAISQKLIFGLLGIPVIGAFALYYLIIELNIPTAFALFTIAIAYPILNAFTLYRSFLTAKHQFALLAFFASTGSFFFLVTTAISIFLFSHIIGLTIGYLLGMIVPSWFGYWYSQRFIKNNSLDKTLPSYSKFLTVLSILPWLSSNLGNIILAKLVGVEALAVYAVASRFFTAVQKNYIVFHKPITAKLATQSVKSHYDTLKMHWWKFIGAGFLLAIGLFIITSPLVTFFFTTTYADAIVYGQLMSIALIPLPLTWVLDDIVVYQKKKTPQVISAIIPGIIKIILYFLLIPKMGIAGLVIIVVIDRFTAPLIPLWYLFFDKKLQKS